eukprot:1140267-Pelagomonas_calceolata.AAC.3
MTKITDHRSKRRAVKTPDCWSAALKPPACQSALVKNMEKVSTSQKAMPIKERFPNQQASKDITSQPWCHHRQERTGKGRSEKVGVYAENLPARFTGGPNSQHWHQQSLTGTGPGGRLGPGAAPATAPLPARLPASAGLAPQATPGQRALLAWIAGAAGTLTRVTHREL